MKKIALLILTLAIVGCGPIKPYEIDIQQGNQIDKQTVNKLHIGMSKDEVVDVIGSPVLGDTFCDDHWSYIYTMQKNGGKIEKRNLELDFHNGKLVKTSTSV